MSGKYSYLLFDLDGTLTDSAEGVTKSVRYSLNKFGIKANLDELKPFIGPPLQASFQQRYGFSESKALEAVSFYREYYRDIGIFENALYPGIPGMLKSLSEIGARLYIATSKPTVFAKKVIRHFNLDHFFICIAGSNLDGSRVLKNEVIDFVLENNKEIELENALMIGDREHDIKGALACGLSSVGVTYGYGSYAELAAAGATHIVESIRELEKLLLKHFTG